MLWVMFHRVEWGAKILAPRRVKFHKNFNKMFKIILWKHMSVQRIEALKNWMNFCYTWWALRRQCHTVMCSWRRDKFERSRSRILLYKQILRLVLLVVAVFNCLPTFFWHLESVMNKRNFTFWRFIKFMAPALWFSYLLLTHTEIWA